MTKIIISLIMILSVTIGYAQNLTPQWMKRVPQAGNATYEFHVFRIQGSNLSAAKKKLPNEVVFYMDRKYEVKGVTVETFDKMDAYVDGQRLSYQLDKIKDSTITVAESIQVSTRIIDEYQKDGNTYFLCTVSNPKSRSAVYDQISLTNKYEFKHVWGSFLVPGWGQMNKGDYLKGGLMMGGTVILTGATIFTESQRRVYVSKIEQTHSENVIRSYINRANAMSITRNICIGGLCALYIYNIIDAFVAPGAKRVEVVSNGIAYRF